MINELFEKAFSGVKNKFKKEEKQKPLPNKGQILLSGIEKFMKCDNVRFIDCIDYRESFTTKERLLLQNFTECLTENQRLSKKVEKQYKQEEEIEKTIKKKKTVKDEVDEKKSEIKEKQKKKKTQNPFQDKKMAQKIRGDYWIQTIENDKKEKVNRKETMSLRKKIEENKSNYSEISCRSKNKKVYGNLVEQEKAQYKEKKYQSQKFAWNQEWFIERIEELTKKKSKKCKVHEINYLDIKTFQGLKNISNLLVLVEVENKLVGIYSAEGTTALDIEDTGRGIICEITKKKKFYMGFIDHFNYLHEDALRFGNAENMFVEFALNKEFEMSSNEPYLVDGKGKISIQDIYFYQVSFR